MKLRPFVVVAATIAGTLVFFFLAPHKIGGGITFALAASLLAEAYFMGRKEARRELATAPKPLRAKEWLCVGVRFIQTAFKASPVAAFVRADKH